MLNCVYHQMRIGIMVVLWSYEWKVTSSNLSRQNLSFIFTKSGYVIGNFGVNWCFWRVLHVWVSTMRVLGKVNVVFAEPRFWPCAAFLA